jgi:hypothetical protein
MHTKELFHYRNLLPIVRNYCCASQKEREKNILSSSHGTSKCYVVVVVVVWVSSLAYPNLLGTKGYVVVVVVCMELANACSLQKAYLGFDRASIS